jgi:hypothetical protein
MKQFLISLMAFAATTTALAKCYDIQGKLDQVGPVRLAANATRMCVSTVHGFAGDFIQASFKDQQGDLAIIQVTSVGRPRCLNCTAQFLYLGRGNSDGRNVDFTGAILTLNEPAGTLAISGVQQTYMIRAVTNNNL